MTAVDSLRGILKVLSHKTTANIRHSTALNLKFLTDIWATPPVGSGTRHCFDFLLYECRQKPWASWKLKLSYFHKFMCKLKIVILLQERGDPCIRTSFLTIEHRLSTKAIEKAIKHIYLFSLDVLQTTGGQSDRCFFACREQCSLVTSLEWNRTLSKSSCDRCLKPRVSCSEKPRAGTSRNASKIHQHLVKLLLVLNRKLPLRAVNTKTTGGSKWTLTMFVVNMLWANTRGRIFPQTKPAKTTCNFLLIENRW